MTLQEVLKANKEKMRLERLERDRKEQKHNIIRNIVLVGLLFAVILLTNYSDRKAIEKCTQDHDIEYCIAGL